MERQELQVHQAPPAQQEREESRDLRDSTAFRVCLDQQALQESQGNPVLRVWLVRLVLQVPQEPGVSEARLVREVKSDQMDFLDLRVALELLDLMDQREQREPKAVWESSVLRG